MNRLEGEPLKMGARVGFDKQSGHFQTRRQQTGAAQSSNGPRPFAEIHALQLLPEHVDDLNGGRWSYELNLVLKDASRVHIVDHTDLPVLHGDAAWLAQVIGCNIWDASERLSAFRQSQRSG